MLPPCRVPQHSQSLGSGCGCCLGPIFCPVGAPTCLSLAQPQPRTSDLSFYLTFPGCVTGIVAKADPLTFFRNLFLPSGSPLHLSSFSGRKLRVCLDCPLYPTTRLLASQPAACTFLRTPEPSIDSQQGHRGSPLTVLPACLTSPPVD